MPELLTESFCERCGTRYTFETPEPKAGRAARLKQARTLARGLRNYVLQDDLPLETAMADARRDDERDQATQQLEAFHQTFNFCMDCRQYTCLDCWNEAEGRCLSCAPRPGVIEPIHHHHEAPPASLDQPAPLEATGWPTEDVGAPLETTLSAAALEAIGLAPETRPADVGTEAPKVESHDPADIAQPTTAGPSTLREAIEAVAEATTEDRFPQPGPAHTAVPADEAHREPLPEALLGPAPAAATATPTSGPSEPASTIPESIPATPEAAPAAQLEEVSEPVAASPNGGIPPAVPYPSITGRKVSAWPPPQPVASDAPRPSFPRPTAPQPPAAPSPWPPLAAPEQGEPAWPTGPSPLVPPPALNAQAQTPGNAIPGPWDASAAQVTARSAGSSIQSCISCGLALSATAHFCRRCGTRQNT
jgi:ribosomal protein L40E